MKKPFRGHSGLLGLLPFSACDAMLAQNLVLDVAARAFVRQTNFKKW